MSYAEFLSWVRYANKTGPLRSAKYLSMTAGSIAAQFAGAYLKKESGGNFSISDFLLWGIEQEKGVGDPDQVFEMFKAIAAGNQDGK